MQKLEETVRPCAPLSKFSGALQWIVETLPRKNICFTVNRSNTQVSDVEISPVEVLSAGWYYFETVVKRNNGLSEGTLTAVTGGEALDYRISNVRNGAVREVFFLPQSASSIIWRPCSGHKACIQGAISITKIGHIESVLRRLYRVLVDLWRFRMLPATERNKLNLKSVIFELSAAYKESGEVRVRQCNLTDYATWLSRRRRYSRFQSIYQIVQSGFVNKLYAISVVVCCEDRCLEPLRTLLASLKKQTHKTWELVLVTLSADVHSVMLATGDLFGGDSRCKLSVADDGASMADKLNAGVSIATGEWIMFPRFDSVLSSDCLRIFSRKIASDIFDIVYCDHDHISARGERFSPHFKPGWSPELLLRHNYIGESLAFRTDTLKQLGGIDSRFPHAELYELLVRYCLIKPDAMVGHVSKVLYHRSAPSCDPGWKSSVHQAEKMTLRHHLPDCVVSDGLATGLYQVDYTLSVKDTPVSIIVLTRDKEVLLRACLESIFKKTKYPCWELLVVDNGSQDVATISYLADISRMPNVKVLRETGPFNYSGLNNMAVSHAKGEVLAFLNNDVEVLKSDWLQRLAACAAQPAIGAVGAKLLYPDGTVQHVGVALGIGGVAGHMHRSLAGSEMGHCNRAVVTHNVSAVTGACLVVRKALFEKVGGFNEEELRCAFNDIDFCLKLLNLGFRNVVMSEVRLIHHESMTRGVDDTEEKRQRFAREFKYMVSNWKEMIDDDVYYNSNLTRDCESYGFRV